MRRTGRWKGRKGEAGRERERGRREEEGYKRDMDRYMAGYRGSRDARGAVLA